ncbi:hypothetical protein [Mesorhizobium sp. CN2-181]|uniref:hypothetical protein n=1 Tax=Mesorhizobium yinganensis TaxID=3157707 RepID=UPI0032B72350
MSIAQGKFQVYAPPLAWADMGWLILDVMKDKASGAWFFGAFPGESDQEAGDRCSWNWAPNASNTAEDRNWINGVPTFFPNYVLAQNGKPLVTRLPPWGASGGALFSLACTTDSTIGLTSNDRALIAGDYNNSNGGGFGMEFSDWANGRARVIDFAVGAPNTPVTATIGTNPNDLSKWRLWYGATSTELVGKNLSGDGSTPNPGPMALSGGRREGQQAFALFGRITTGANYTPTVTKKVSFVIRVDEVPSVNDLATLKAECEVLAGEQGVTLLSVTP